MKELLLFSTTVMMGFFAIMNPIGNTPIFLGLVESMDAAGRRKAARDSVLLAFAIVSLFTLFGGTIFQLFGITLPAFRIAGGILVFLVGYQLLHGRQSAIHHPAPGEKHDGDPDDVAITPLAIPILAGPGTISTAINFAGQKHAFEWTWVVIACFAVICVATYLAFVSGERIVAFAKPGIIKVVTRLMGLIITVMSVQMVITGIDKAIEMYR